MEYLLTGDVGKLFGYDKLEKGSDMLYSNGPIYCGNKNWILDIMDNPFGMTGYNFNIFKKNIKQIADSLEADNCKKIIVRSDDSITIMRKYFSDKVINKISLEKVELPKKEYVKKKKPYFQILMMGSINNPGDFYNKGGLIALEVFEKLSKAQNVKLVIRCDIPTEILTRVKNNPNIDCLNSKRLTDNEMNDLYEQSDILIATNPVMPFMVTLEAKAYNLPMICYDCFAIKSYIKDQENGFIIDPPEDIKAILQSEEYPSNLRTPEILKTLKKTDPIVINKICNIINNLINIKND